MAVKTILKHARSVRKSGQNYIAMAHRLWREHIAEGLELASYDTLDVVFAGSLSAETGLPVHIVPEDCELVKVQLAAGAAGTADSTVKLAVGANDLFAAVTLNDTATKTGTLASAQVARSAGDVVKLVSTVGTTPASDVVVTLTYKRLKNQTR